MRSNYTTRLVTPPHFHPNKDNKIQRGVILMKTQENIYMTSTCFPFIHTNKSVYATPLLSLSNEKLRA